MDHLEQDSLKQSMIFTHRMIQLSKALWKSIEKDWQAALKQFDLNINEHHILWIAYHLDGATISDLSKFGVMHVSTAFNFSKKLEERNLVQFSKKDDDKRNTYIRLTEEGVNLFYKTIEQYDPSNYQVHDGAMPLKNIFGKFPELSELVGILRNIYGDDFIDSLQTSMDRFDRDFIESEQGIKKR